MPGSTNRFANRPPALRQAGASIIEYIVLAAVLVLGLVLGVSAFRDSAQTALASEGSELAAVAAGSSLAEKYAENSGSSAAAGGGSANAEGVAPAPRGGSVKPSGAVKGAHNVATKSPGWAKLSPARQKQVLALLGGNRNAQSKMARREFANHYRKPGWKKMSAAAQAKIMKSLLTSAAARPGLVPSIGGAKASPYKLSKPTLVKNHSFNGIKANANRYTVTVGTTKATIFVPVKPNKKQGRFHTIKHAAAAYSALPTANRALVKTITVNAIQNPDDAYWAKKYKDPNFRSYMTAGAAGDIMIYPTTGGAPRQLDMNTSMIHETGHTWSMKKWGSKGTERAWNPWKAAMKSDTTSVSDYATNSIKEDVAETIRAYVDSKGTPQHAEYRAMFPARFKILDPFFKK